MATFRKVVFANDQIYHVFNRGVDRRSVFLTNWEYSRVIETIKYYRFSDLPFRLSKLLNLPQAQRIKLLSDIQSDNEKLVEIISFCIMPNHFHLMLKQLKEGGISKFISNLTNSYTKYFNTKHERVGPLFEGIFKAVIVETDEQLIHLSRYIHLNPVSSFIIQEKDLENYPWSSLPEYLGKSEENFCKKETVMDLFKNIKDYKKFIMDQISYAKELEKIKHIALE